MLQDAQIQHGIRPQKVQNNHPLEIPLHVSSRTQNLEDGLVRKSVRFGIAQEDIYTYIGEERFPRMKSLWQTALVGMRSGQSSLLLHRRSRLRLRSIKGYETDWKISS